jgi:hypothetical protein
VATTPAVGKAWARELYAMFAPTREEAQTMGEAEIDVLVNEALDEVRSQHSQRHPDLPAR